MNGGNTEQIEFIPRITLSTLEDDFPFILTRKQFRSMTINKPGGQSLSNVGIDLRYLVFMHGQLRVALSRSTNIEGMHALFNQDDSTQNNTIENIIYCRISSTISNINTFEVLIIIWNPYYKPDIFIIMTYVQWPYK
jgi:hypothetical protein